jgi:uncharacterized membrane protein HdeD (DUF308 family)
MTTATPDHARAVDELPGWVRGSWLIPLVLGLLMVVLGIVLLFNLGASVGTLRWLVVISLLFSAVEALATASLRSKPWVGYLVGALYFVGAVVGVLWPGITLFVLVIVVGASLFAGGLVQAGLAFSGRRTTRGWGWAFAAGIVSVIAGLIFLFGSPVLSVLALALVLAVQVIVAGAVLVSLAFALRKVTR